MLVTFLFESRREEELTKAGEIRLTAVLEGLGKLLDHLLLLLINVHIGGIQQSTNERIPAILKDAFVNFTAHFC